MSGLSIAKSLELHLLGPNLTAADVRHACQIVAESHIAAVCVAPIHVAAAVAVLDGSDTRVAAAIGLPFGVDLVATKRDAAERALQQGADHLVIALCHASLRACDERAVRAEVDELVSSAFRGSLTSPRGRGEPTLVAETPSHREGALALLAGALEDRPVGFLQTGSGHLPRAVDDDHVRSLRTNLPDHVAITAAGGVGTLLDARELLAAGASRIATGAAVSILEQERQERQVRQS